MIKKKEKWIFIVCSITSLVIIFGINRIIYFISNPIPIKTIKYWSPILTGFASIGTIVLVTLSFCQFIKFNKEYSIRNKPKVIPYVDIVTDGEGESLILLKFYNSSDIVAENIGIEIDNKWLEVLSKVGKNEKRRSEILKELGTYQNIYITNKQEHNYLIGFLSIYKELTDTPIEITIKYYKSKKIRHKAKPINKPKPIREEYFTIYLRDIGNKAENLAQTTLLEEAKISELKNINRSLNNKTNYKSVF